jgi:hypothetical protein
MDASRCMTCRKRLIALTERKGRTRLVCLVCDKIDPLKTEIVKWANGNLGRRPNV